MNVTRSLLTRVSKPLSRSTECSTLFAPRARIQMLQPLKLCALLFVVAGNGYITTAVLRDILHELDDKLTPDELDAIIEEIDEDGSGTIDFDGAYTHCIEPIQSNIK